MTITSQNPQRSGAVIYGGRPGRRVLQVLVVDDSSADAALVTAALARDRSTAFSVDVVTTVADACDHVRRQAPDCVLLDLGLSDTEGLEGLHRMLDEAPELAVIVVTGWDDTDMAFDAVAAGAQDYLVKDRMDVELLGRAVRYAVSRKETEQEIVEREQKMRSALAALEQSEARYRTLVAVLEEGVLLEDRHGRVLTANASAQRILGHAQPSLLNGGWTVVHDDETPWPVEELPWTVALRSGYGVVGSTLGIVREDGPVTWLSLTSQPLQNANEQRPHAVVTSFTDISEQRATERRLRELALHDSLTGLPNRTLLVSRIDRALRRIRRDGGNVAVLYLDLDRFKPVNDTFGHEAGDELLCAVGRRIVDTLRPTDTVARIGGDEFVAVCDRVDTEEEVALLAGRVEALFAEPFELATGPVHVGASVGFALSSPSDHTAADLLRQADSAMFRVKRDRR